MSTFTFYRAQKSNAMHTVQHSTAQYSTVQHKQCNALSIYESCHPSHSNGMVCACMLADSVFFCVRFLATCYCCCRCVPVCIPKESIWTKANGKLKRMKVACNYASIPWDSFLFLSFCLVPVCMCVCHFPIWQWSHFINALYPYAGQEKDWMRCHCKCDCECECVFFILEKIWLFIWFFADCNIMPIL